MPGFELRQATHDDYAFLYRLHVSTMRDLVAEIWGWDDAWQARDFADRFDPTTSRVIVVDGHDAGVVAIDWCEDLVFIAKIEIAPERQGRGLGAAVIGAVLVQADARRLPVGLQVFKINRARRLYERLGFTVLGETATHFLMERSPA